MSAPLISRRDLLRLSSLGVLGASASGWLENLAEGAAPAPRRKSCILLWMNGGPSQTDTFDCKPKHDNGGGVKEIQTLTPGLKISEFLPKLTKHSEKLAIIRSMTSKEGDHGRATHLLRTGYLPQGSVAYPTLGSLVAKELATERLPLPAFVSIAPYRLFNQAAFSSGFLGPKYAPLIVADAYNGFTVNNTGYDTSLKVKDLEPAGKVSGKEVDARIDLLKGLSSDFRKERPDAPATAHQAAYLRAIRLMKSEARKAFDLDQEKKKTRDAYGRNLFGQGCLLARRLVERGVPFVEVNMTGVNGGAFGWDTHANNYDAVKSLCQTLDPAWTALMSDLKERGLLNNTLIVWMGEFGRTPKLNQSRGRDHYPNAWSTVLAGAGIKGGQAYGETSKDGTTVEKNKVTVPDLMATICKALGLDHEKQNMTNGRPIRLADKGANPVKAIVG